MHRRLVAIAAAIHLLAGAPLAAQSAGADSTAEREVLAVVQQLWDGMRTRDTVLLGSLFHPKALLWGVRQRQDGSEVVEPLEAAKFIEAVARSPRGPWIERSFDPRVHIDRTLATVWTDYDFHIGTEFSHCGVDAFQMLRTADGWKIVSLADTFSREGCVQRPPPSQ